VNKCLHTVALSWTFLLTLNHDARNHEFKKNNGEHLSVMPSLSGLLAYNSRMFLKANGSSRILLLCTRINKYETL